MESGEFVGLIHLVGFVTGIALYGMLAVMTWRHSEGGGAPRPGVLPVLAALLGLIWNVGALVVFGLPNFGFSDPSAWVAAIAYSALGFLPAVVVDAATRSPRGSAGPSLLAVSAYGLSGVATALEVGAVVQTGNISKVSLWVLTLGYFAILLVLAVTTRGRTGSQRALTAVALAAFAATAFHLTQHSRAQDPWWLEIVGHHSSLPLVLVILYQDYRFAFADLFLKRALSVLALVAGVLGGYELLIAPLMTQSSVASARLPAVLIMAWLATALCYPVLKDGVERFVDHVILGRTDYQALRARIGRGLSDAGSESEALDLVCAQLGPAVSARSMTWELAPIERSAQEGTLVDLQDASGARVRIPTTAAPAYRLCVGELAPGRRLLSDDVALLDAGALLVVRRIEELRMERERLQRNVRESEMQRLAAESELRALRAQLNPHFLFNALTTIGFLIRTSPNRALETLYQLTSLLRAVLRKATGDYVTLAEELSIVESYIAIETARFEERLRVERSVAPDLASVPIPPLILQPIVENAIKHGIAPLKGGGVVSIAATTSTSSVNGAERTMLRLTVTDSGVGVPARALDRALPTGVGLGNIERRLSHYYGAAGSLRISNVEGGGTRVEITVPMVHGEVRAQGDDPFARELVALPVEYRPSAVRAREAARR
ncbi:MAG TPA: histidine kinase [Gemmatimonadaceae bacterium]|nr:histidine kinase [Gemmatimonadaceae bacterium]